MRKVLAFAFCLLVAEGAYAGNIAVIDGSADPIYLQSVAPKLIEQKCFSLSDRQGSPLASSTGSQSGVDKFLRYFWVSGCPDGGREENRIGPRENVASSELLNGGFNYVTLSDDHLSNVVDIALQHSSQLIVPIGAVVYATKTSLETSPSNLEPKTEIDSVERAIDWIIENRARHNIRVLNMSFGNAFIEGANPCSIDSLESGFQTIAQQLRFLFDSGVALVAAAGNTQPQNSEPGQEFPACLDFVISVGGITHSDGKNYYYGASSAAINFFDDPLPLTSAGDTIIGTSFAAPKISGTISSMMGINPTLSTSEVIQRLFDTQDDTGRVYYFSEPNKYDTNRKKINQNAALESVKDPIWREIYKLIIDLVNSVQAGWNYGSNQHPNGAQFLFSSDGLIDQKQSNPLQKEAYTTLSQKSLLAGDSAVLFSLEPYDIDTVDEVEVIVNGISYGFLAKTNSNETGPRQTVCINPSDLKVDGSDNSVQLKLKNTGETWGVNDIQIQAGVADATCLSKDSGIDPLQDSQERLVGASELFGNAYTEGASNGQVPLSFSVSTLSPENFSTTEVKRDLRISFIAKSGDTSSTDNSTIVRLNGQEVYRSEEFFGSDERSFEFILSRNELSDGSNTLTFLPRRTGSSMVWGIRNISVEYIEPITLSLDQTDRQRYGYLETPTRLTGLRTNLAITDIEKDYLLSVTGWGIDLEDESEVFLNGNSLGNLRNSQGLVTSLAPETAIILPQSLLLEGLNQVEFVQREPSSTWQGELFIQWGVEQLNLTALAPDFSNPSVSILTEALDPSTPFTLSANITNIGEGYAKPSTLRFVLSQDDVISVSQDSLLGSVQTIGINAGASVEFMIEAQTTLVDQGLFVGACIQSIDDEIRISNNCSPAVKLKSVPKTIIMSPIYQLLLDE